MPNYETDGTENLRANPSVKHVDGDRSPGGSGKDAGGTENKGTSTKVLAAGDKPLPDSYRHDVPPGLQNFDDNGQKDGGTKYLGR